jgi:hypothetical protein
MKERGAVHLVRSRAAVVLGLGGLSGHELVERTRDGSLRGVLLELRSPRKLLDLVSAHPELAGAVLHQLRKADAIVVSQELRSRIEAGSAITSREQAFALRVVASSPLKLTPQDARGALVNTCGEAFQQVE